MTVLWDDVFGSKTFGMGSRLFYMLNVALLEFFVPFGGAEVSIRHKNGTNVRGLLLKIINYRSLFIIQIIPEKGNLTSGSN